MDETMTHVFHTKWNFKFYCFSPNHSRS